MPRPYSMTQRSGFSAATRARVLDAVLDLILEHGPEAVTIQAVAARADVAPRTVYNHFTSRDDLLAAAWADLASEVSEVAVQTADAAAAAPREALMRFVRATFEQIDERSPRLGAILAIRGYQQLDEAVARVRGARREKLRQMLEPAARSDELRIPLEEAVALAYVMTANSTWQCLVGQLRLPATKAISLLTRHLDDRLFEGGSAGPPADELRDRSRDGPESAGSVAPGATSR